MKRAKTKTALSLLASVLLTAGVYACGASTDAGGDPSGNGDGNGEPGDACDADDDCRSGECENGECTDGGETGNAGSDGSGGSTSSGGSSSSSGGSGDSGGSGGSSSSSGGSSSGGTNSGGSTGTGQPGDDCTEGGDCASGLCVSGECSAQGTGGTGTSGPHFPGSGTGVRPLTTGCGPETADECTGTCEQMGGDPNVDVIRPPATLCYAGEGDPTPDDPAVVIEQVIETLNGVTYAHLRVTFDPAFTDNTFGEGSCCGWPERRGHTFEDLIKSDHTELLLTNGDGETVMHFKVDLATADADSPCGYGTLGVSGGDGSMLVGDPAHVLAVATSLDRNLNGCGYCQNDACASSGDCTVDSPATDENFTPNPETPKWDYRQVYEVWIAMDAFGDSGFGQGYITYTHSSPAKGPDTIYVEPTPCPPEWDGPYCPPGEMVEGGNCNTTDGPCPPNEQIYITSEGASICTPIPFTNFDDMKPCPEGYELDLISEGQYCVPVT
jgi:hypothetical protein